MIEDLAASPTWRSSHISPGDVTLLRRRWPKALFRTMQRHSKEVERLLRFSRRRPEWEFQHNKPGFCSLCQEQIATALGIHMMNVHLELGQLWWCLVEWCTIWKGSVSDCLGHLQDKHGGSQYVGVKNLGKFFPPWTVSRDLWRTALHPDISGIAVDVRLFHEAGCCLVHKYRVYKDPFPHLALRGGGGVINRLLALVYVGGHSAVEASPHLDSCVGGATRRGHRGMFSTRSAFTGTGGPPSRIVRQWSYGSGWRPDIGAVGGSDPGGPSGYSDT